ncbi:MAG TPA: type IV secretion system DNA-binding domain-containing protein [Verrucomicrobiae bacterium]|nr:type IV secretion system DNA-binding domain-containing protein [Verrucomicrobiae bacterium]
MLPLASGKLDPFIGIVGALAELQPEEFALFQVLWQPVQNPWAENITDAVTHSDGKPFFIDSPELTSAAEDKISRPLYAAVVRIATQGETHERALQIACDMASSLRVFAQPQGNELIPLENDEEYPVDDHIEDVLRRQSRRSGMLLNSDELIGFVHLPSSAVRSPVLARDSFKTKAAPAVVRNPTGLLLGSNFHNGESIPVRLTAEQRVRHTHIIGATGTGKSTLLFNLIRQDIENRQGVGVLDPSGDLIDRILDIIPDSRIDDVILVNPYDTDFPIGFNILQAHSEDEKNVLASDLVSMFRRLSTSWGDQMDVVMRNAIRAFLESSTGGTLADLQSFLIDDEFRIRFLDTVRDEGVLDFWRRVFPRLTGGKSISSVLIRLHTFLDQKPFRLMVTQRENRLDFANIMDTGKIFLAKLPEGLMGAEDSYMLGTLLVSKFQQTAMTRQAQAASARQDFWLYIDEFDNFITPSMAWILSKTRKYRLGLTLAHHELHQLQADSKVASAVMSNPATRVVFRVGDDDAKKLADGFSFFEAQDFKNLADGQAICRVERSDFDFNLSVPWPEKADEAAAVKRREKIITASRAQYGTPRAQVKTTSPFTSEGGQPSPKPAKLETPPVTEPISSSPPPVANPHVSETPKDAEIPKSIESERSIKDIIIPEAESLDYTVREEITIPGHGRPDLILTRGKRSLACEINATTRPETEADHIRLRLKAGFSHVAVVSLNRRSLQLIKEAYLRLGANADVSKVGFYTPQEFITQLFNWAADDPEGGAIQRGQPVKRKDMPNSSQLSDEERKQRHKDELEKLIKAMKR